MSTNENGKYASPWIVGEPGLERFEDLTIEDGKRIIWGSDGMEICLVRYRGGMVPDIARLIAEAPDLFSELDLAAFALEQLSRHIPEPLAMQAKARAASARAAIAKAEGR